MIMIGTCKDILESLKNIGQVQKLEVLGPALLMSYSIIAVKENHSIGHKWKEQR